MSRRRLPAIPRKRGANGKNKLSPYSFPEMTAARVEIMAMKGCTGGEIANFFGCEKSNVYVRYGDLLKHCEAVRAEKLRALIDKACEDKNATLLIWMSKQQLGMREPERQEQAPQINFNIINRQFGNGPSNESKTIEVKNENAEEDDEQT